MGKSQGLSPAERIRRTREFDRVFREGKRRRGKLLGIRGMPNERSHARLGIALSRAWKGAVRRNRAKRVVREAFRTHKDALPKGIDLIVVPHPGWGEPTPAEVAAELARLLGGEGRRENVALPPSAVDHEAQD